MKPVVVVSSKGFFGFAHVNSYTCPGLRLMRLPEPQKHAGRLYQWIAEECDFNERGDAVKVRRTAWLPAKSEAQAVRMFDQLARDAKRTLVAKRKRSSSRSQAIQAARLIVLSKRYPRAVGLFREVGSAKSDAEREELRRQLWEAYAEESAIACDGSPVVEPVTNNVSLKRIAAGLEAARKRKPPGPEVAAALVLGCAAKDFDGLTFQEIKQRLELHGFKNLSVDGLRKQWKRLGLPSARKRGRR